MRISFCILLSSLLLVSLESYSQIDSTYTTDDNVTVQVDSENAAESPKHVYIYPKEDETITKPILTSSDWKKTVEGMKFPDGTENVNETQRQINLPWLKYVIYAFSFLIFIFLIYNIVKMLLKPSNKKVESEITENEIDPEILPVENLELLLKDALEKGDLRGAVRYSYLITLRNLSDRNLIFRTKDKTNFDYINELAKHPFLNIFREITRAFEITWYGEIIPGESEYKNFENKFIMLNNSITKDVD